MTNGGVPRLPYKGLQEYGEGEGWRYGEGGGGGMGREGVEVWGGRGWRVLLPLHSSPSLEGLPG